MMRTTPSQLDRADARQRASRTLIQGLAVDLVLAMLVTAAATLLPLMTAAEPAEYLRPELWLLLGAAALKSSIVAAVSYAARLRSAPPPVE